MRSSKSHILLTMFSIRTNNTRHLFETSILPQIKTALNGVNVTVLAFGQTCSGKTFTMQGTKEQPGVIPLTISAIFQLLKNRAQDLDPSMSVSYLEIYNDSINDLLNEKNKNLELRTINSHECAVYGLSQEEVKSEDYIFQWLEKGTCSRFNLLCRRRSQESGRDES